MLNAMVQTKFRLAMVWPFQFLMLDVHMWQSFLPLYFKKNVLHVAKISKNLRSVSQFVKDNNAFIEFHPDYCLVKNRQGKILLTRVLEDGLYMP